MGALIRISVIISGGDLSMVRYTAQVQSNGFLRFVEYDELERQSVRQSWRKIRTWSIHDPPEGGTRFDGVELVKRPELSKDIRKRLLAAARDQIEWGRE